MSEHEDLDFSEDGEFDLDKVLEDLAKKRAAEEKGTLPLSEAFHMQVMGGAWCMAHHGVPYDSFRACWKIPAARQFLYTYSFSQSATFTLNKYGEPLARCLAQYWISKMTGLFTIWDANGRGKYKFSDADVASFVEPTEFVAAWDVASAAQRANGTAQGFAPLGSSLGRCESSACCWRPTVRGRKDEQVCEHVGEQGW